MALWRNVVCVLALLCLQFGGTFVGGASKVSHVPVLVALTEGESITYGYDCEEPERAVLCHYTEDGSMSYPEIVREQHDLPDGMSLVQQECPLYNVASARINASLSIWGLLLFFSPDGRCGIEKSTGPRPLRLIVTEADDQDDPSIVTTEQGQVLNYSCPCEPSVVICVRHELEEPQLLTPSLMESVTIENHQCGDESSDWGPSAMITSSEETAGVTFFCGHKADECNIQLSIGPRPMRTLMVNDSHVHATRTPDNGGGVSSGTVGLAVGGSAIVVASVVVAVLLLWFYCRKSPNNETGLEECGESSSSEASLSNQSESVSTETQSQQFTDHPPTPLQYSTEGDDGPPPNLNQV